MSRVCVVVVDFDFSDSCGVDSIQVSGPSWEVAESELLRRLNLDQCPGDLREVIDELKAAPADALAAGATKFSEPLDMDFETFALTARVVAL